jgi:prepilin-type N-terminal cleavage/methylation domain-containing protein
MEQHRHCNLRKNTKAFTMIELLIAMGIVTIITVGAIFAWKENKNKVIFKQAKESVLLALEKARNRAETGFQNDANSRCHGVKLNGNMLVISERCGTSCETDCGEITNTYLPASVTILNLPVTFQRITGESADKDIRVSYGGKTSIIKVKPDGAIYEVMP